MGKRAFDLGIAAISMVALLPLFMLISIAIVFSSRGPIFYRAPRVGRGGRLFRMFKFRTMKEHRDDKGPRVTAADDPRITRLGRFLRVTKLNELPQLINVIKGEMSLVGPRPEDPEFVKFYPAEYAEILSIRPGITSPAAIIYYDEERLLSFSRAAGHYVNEILPRKLRLDLLYVRHHTFLIDLDVIFQTLHSSLPSMRAVVPEIDEILFGPIQRVVRKHLPWFVIDWIVGALGIGLAGVIWRVRTPLDIGLVRSLLAALLLASAFSLVNWATGVHRTSWKQASNSDAMYVTFSASLATALLVVTNKYFFTHQIFPSGMVLLGCLFSLIGFILIRYWRQFVHELSVYWAWDNSAGSNRENIIIVGAGDAAISAARILRDDPRGRNYNLVGFVDDDPMKRRSRIQGINVLGPTRHIPRLVRDHGVTALIFAIHNCEISSCMEIIRLCESSGARVIRIPDTASAIYAELTVNSKGDSQAPSRNLRQNKGQQDFLFP